MSLLECLLLPFPLLGTPLSVLLAHLLSPFIVFILSTQLLSTLLILYCRCYFSPTSRTNKILYFSFSKSYSLCFLCVSLSLIPFSVKHGYLLVTQIQFTCTKHTATHKYSYRHRCIEKD